MARRRGCCSRGGGRLLAGANLVDSDSTDPTVGTVEFEAALRSPAGDSAAEVVGIKTGIGRIVRLDSDDLPILPKGEYYEVWFVGPGDYPGEAQPNLCGHVPP